MRAFSITVIGLLAACNGDKTTPDTDEPVDTSDPVDSGDSGDTGVEPTCETTVYATTPEDETKDFYYRDPISVTFSDDASDAVITLTDGSGAAVGVSTSWSDGNFVATITPDSPLAGSTDYKLHIEICEYAGDLSFTTSPYGDALVEEPPSLEGNTYVFDLSKADIVEPEGLGYLLKSYLTQPLLIGVDHADASTIGLIGAQGELKTNGSYVQYGSDVWIFPDADFGSAPFFVANTDRIVIDYSSIEIPLETFYLEGSFAPDGSSIGGGYASGWGDTRNMGPLLGLSDDPNAVCGLIDSLQLGINCEECSDGGAYCLFLAAEFGEAALEEGLTIK